MADLSPYDIRSGRTFIPQCVKDQKFRNLGVLYGHSGGLWWAVIDPERHPLTVWKETGNSRTSYASTAEALGAVCFSNGPMMERFTQLGSALRVGAQMAYDGVQWAAIGAAAGFLVAGPKGALVGGGIGLVFGLVVGYRAGTANTFGNWVPYDVVHGATHLVDDPGSGWTGFVHLGRTSAAFATYVVGDGRPGKGFAEVIGGLTPVVRHFFPVSVKPGTPNYHSEWAKLSTQSGLLAWGIVPLSEDVSNVPIPQTETGLKLSAGQRTVLGPHDFIGVSRVMPGQTQPMPGVLVCIGNGGGKSAYIFMMAAGAILANIGTRDAVAMDGSDSVMMGAAAEHFLPKPPGSKQLIQRYGFYC
jgi:hypothetical protein